MGHAAAISSCYDHWFQAVMDGDTSPLAKLLATDFCYVDIFGVVRDRAGYHTLLAQVPPGTVVMTLGSLEARPLGHHVHALGDYTVKGSLSDGQDVSSHTRFTSVWSLDTGGWHCHRHHATNIA